MSDRFRVLREGLEYHRSYVDFPINPRTLRWLQDNLTSLIEAATAAEERDALREQNAILTAESQIRLDDCHRWEAEVAALKAKLKAVERTLTESRERAARELWDKDDALTIQNRKIAELEAALGESRRKVEELEDRLNDIHIHNLERD